MGDRIASFRALRVYHPGNPRRPSFPLTWTWADLLAFLGRWWPWLVLEEDYPLPVRPLFPAYFLREFSGRIFYCGSFPGKGYIRRKRMSRQRAQGGCLCVSLRREYRKNRRCSFHGCLFPHAAKCGSRRGKPFHLFHGSRPKTVKVDPGEGAQPCGCCSLYALVMSRCSGTRFSGRGN